MKRCPVYQFKKYLDDMGTLKLYLVDKRNTKAVGLVSIDLVPHMVKHIDYKNPKALKNIHDVFDVHKITSAVASTVFSQKIGEIEITIKNVFRNQVDHLKDEPVRENSPNIIDRSAIIQTITDSQAKIGGRSVKIGDIKNSKYIDPFSKEADHKIAKKNDNPDLSNILNYAENVLNEIDREYNTKSADHEIKNLIDNYDNENVKERQDPEIELQMLRLKRYERNPEIKVDKSIVHTQDDKVNNNLSIEKLKEPATLFIYVADMTVNSQNFSKLLNEDICTLEISLKAGDGTQKDVHKFFIKSSSKMKVFTIDKTVAFDLKFSDSKSLQEFINSTISFKLCQRKKIDKGKTTQMVIAEYSMNTLDCLNQASNDNATRTIKFHISEKRSKTPVKANPANLKKVSKDSAFGELHIQIRKGLQQNQSNMDRKKESKVEQKIGIVAYMTEIRNIQLSGDYISVSTGGLDTKPSKQAINIIDADEHNLYVDYSRLIYLDKIPEKPLVFKFFSRKADNEAEEVLGFCSLPLEIDNEILNNAKDECFVIENGLFEVIDVMKQPKFFVYLKIFVGNTTAALKLYNEICNSMQHGASQKVSKTIYQSNRRSQKQPQDHKYHSTEVLSDKKIKEKESQKVSESQNYYSEKIAEVQKDFKSQKVPVERNASNLMIKQSAIDKLKQILSPEADKLYDSRQISLQSQKELQRLSEVFEVRQVESKAYSRSLSDLKQISGKIRSEPVASLMNSGFTKIKNNLVTANGEDLIVNNLESDKEFNDDYEAKNEGTFSYYMKQFKIQTGGKKPKFDTFAPNKLPVTESDLEKIDLPLVSLNDNEIIEDPLRLLVRLFDLLIKTDVDLIKHLNIDFLTYQDVLALVQQYDLNLVVEEVDLLLVIFDYRNEKTISKDLIEDAFRSYLEYRNSFITKNILKHFPIFYNQYDEIKKQLQIQIEKLNGRTQSSYLTKNLTNDKNAILAATEDIYSKIIYSYDKKATENNLDNFIKIMDRLLYTYDDPDEFKNALNWLLNKQPVIELSTSFNDTDIKEYYKRHLDVKRLDSYFKDKNQNVNLTTLLTAIDETQERRHDLCNVYKVTCLFNNILYLKGDMAFSINDTIPYASLQPYLGIEQLDNYDDLISLLNPHLPIKQSTFKNKYPSRFESSFKEDERKNESVKEDDTILTENRSFHSLKKSGGNIYKEPNTYDQVSQKNDDSYYHKDQKFQKNVEDILVKYKKEQTEYKPLAKYTLSIKLNKFELPEALSEEFIGKRIAFRYRLFGSNKNYETVITEIDPKTSYLYLNSKTLHVVYLDATIDYNSRLLDLLHDLEIHLIEYKASGDIHTLGISSISSIKFSKECFIDEKLILVPQGELLNSFGNNIGKLDITVNAHFEITKRTSTSLDSFEDIAGDRNYPLNGYLTIRTARFEKLESLYFITDRLKSEENNIFDDESPKTFKIKISMQCSAINEIDECIYKETFRDLKDLLQLLSNIKLQGLNKINYNAMQNNDFESLKKMLKSMLIFKLYVEISNSSKDYLGDKLLYKAEIAETQLLMSHCLPKYNNDDNEVLLSFEDENKISLLRALFLFNYLPYDQPLYPTKMSPDKNLKIAIKPLKLIFVTEAFDCVGTKKIAFSLTNGFGKILYESKAIHIELHKAHKLSISNLTASFTSFVEINSGERLFANFFDLEQNKLIISTFNVIVNYENTGFCITDSIGYAPSARLLFKCAITPKFSEESDTPKITKITSILNNYMFSSVQLFKANYPYTCNIITSTQAKESKNSDHNYGLMVEWHQFKIFLIDQFEIVKSEGDLLKQNLKSVRNGLVDIRKLIWNVELATCDNMDPSLFKGCLNELRYYDEIVNGITGFISIENLDDITQRYHIHIYNKELLKPNKAVQAIAMHEKNIPNVIDYIALMGTLEVREADVARSFEIISQVEKSEDIPKSENNKQSIYYELAELDSYKHLHFSWKISKLEIKNIKQLLADKSQKPNIYVEIDSETNKEDKIVAKIQYRTIAPVWTDLVPYNEVSNTLKDWLTTPRKLNIYFREFVNRIKNSIVDELNLSIDFRLIDYLDLEMIYRSIKNHTKYEDTCILTKEGVSVYMELACNFDLSADNESSALDAGLLNTIKTLGELRHNKNDNKEKSFVVKEENVGQFEEIDINADLINFITTEIQNDPQNKPITKSYNYYTHENVENTDGTKVDKQLLSHNNIDIKKSNMLVFDFDSDKLLKSLKNTANIIDKDHKEVDVTGNDTKINEYKEETNEMKDDKDPSNEIIRYSNHLGIEACKSELMPAKYIMKIESCEQKSNTRHQEMKANEEEKSKYKEKSLNNRKKRLNQNLPTINILNVAKPEKPVDNDMDLLDLNSNNNIVHENKDTDLYDVQVTPGVNEKPLKKQDTIERVTDAHIRETVENNIKDINKKSNNKKTGHHFQTLRDERKPPVLLKKYTPEDVKAELNYSHSEDDLINMEDSHADIINRLPHDLFSEIEKTRLDRLLRENRFKPEFFDFDSGSDIEQ